MIVNLIAKPIEPKHMRDAEFSFYGKDGRASPSFTSASDAVGWLLANDEVNEFDIVISTNKEMMNAV
jgi:hypothetical protein